MLRIGVPVPIPPRLLAVLRSLPAGVVAADGVRVERIRAGHSHHFHYRLVFVHRAHVSTHRVVHRAVVRHHHAKAKAGVHHVVVRAALRAPGRAADRAADRTASTPERDGHPDQGRPHHGDTDARLSGGDDQD